MESLGKKFSLHIRAGINYFGKRNGKACFERVGPAKGEKSDDNTMRKSFGTNLCEMK